MRIRHGAHAQRTVTAVLVAAALSLSLTACGGGDSGSDGSEGSDKKNTGAATTPRQPGQPDEGEGTTEPQSEEPLAVIDGSNGFQFTVRSAVRDAGGFLTVSGALKNNATKRQVPPVQWNGQESQVRKTGRSFAGMTLVDKSDKKRYYVLRDTDGYPLTTTGLSALDAGQSVDFFAQFPAPPKGTESVDVQIPLMPSASIEIS
ncbi:hypothetical protein [Streptomyces sp. NPDC001889]